MEQSPQHSSCPLAALGTAVSQLLGRAVGACLAASGASEDCTVSLELAQCPQAPGLLGLRVCDDGLPLPDNQQQLERCLASLQLEQLLALPLFSEHTLLVQTTGLEEVVLRRYSARPIDASQQLAVHEEGLQPKPPGTALCGTVIEATVRLQEPPLDGAADGLHGGGSSAAEELLRGGASDDASQLPSSAEACVECLQQLMEMLRALAPPVQLLMRLNGVLLRAPDSSLQPVSGSRRMDLPQESSLAALPRFRAGLASAYLPPPRSSADGQAEAELGAASEEPERRPPGSQALPSGSRMSFGAAQHMPAAAPAGLPGGSEMSSQSQSGAEGGGVGAKADASAAAGARGTAPEYLTLLGVGDAGWGCAEEETQPSRASKWTAQAGVVLQLPDLPSGSLPAGAEQPGSSSSRGSSSRAANAAGGGIAAEPPGTPVFFFRSWCLVPATGGQQAAARRGLERCDWASFGLRLDGVMEDSQGAPLTAAINSVVPASTGLRLAAIVVHMLPREYRKQAEGRAVPALSIRSEALLIRQALQGALHQLKRQRPEAMHDRAERSLSVTLPLLSKSMTGILLQSARHGVEGSSLEEACTAVGCQPAELQGKLFGLLRRVTRMPGTSDDRGSTAAEQAEDAGPAAWDDGPVDSSDNASELMQPW